MYMYGYGRCRAVLFTELSPYNASVLLKCWFYKQAPQEVLIELSPGVIGFFV